METYVVCHIWVSEMCCALLLIRFIYSCDGVAIVVLLTGSRDSELCTVS
jgi:hypothetical protein